MRGTLTVGGEPVQRADVALLDGDRVIAAAAAAGTFSIEVPRGSRPTLLLVRMLAPIAGAVAVAPAMDRAIEIAIPADRIAQLTGDVHGPAGVTLDGVELALTPQLAGVTPLAMLTAGTGPDTRPALITLPLRGPRFTERVVKGTWQLRLGRAIDGPLGSTPPNLAVDKVTATGAPPPTSSPGGVSITVEQDVAVDVTMRIDAR